MIEQELSTQPVDYRRESGDRGNEDGTARPYDASRLSKSLKAVGSIGQVIQRSEQKDCVGAAVIDLKTPSISHAGSDASVEATKVLRGLDVVRHGVDHVHRVTVICEPLGVHAGSAANVDQMERRPGRQMPSDDLLCSQELKLPCAARQPSRFVDLGLVVLANLRGCV